MSREPLSRERVLRAAVALADAGGMDSLSMRKLGQELGVEAMSLYNHVANKDDVLAGIVETVADEIAAPAPDADWRTAIRATAISAHETLVRHPWAAGLWMRRGGGGGRGEGGSPRMRFAETLLAGLEAGGFSPELIYRAFHTLQSYILGYTLQELRFPFETEELEAMAQRFLRDFPVDEYPHLAQHVRQHLEPHAFLGTGFEFGLDLILDGLETARGSS
jgi:AcrR family transcriptional regulator